MTLRGARLAKFDRYMLSQLLLFFGFFSLVLVAVFWINRSVRLFDRLIGDGQTAWVFLELTSLGLPRLILTVLPLSAFAASVYVVNRLSNESEMTVMSATGSSPWRLARPVLVFGLIVGAMMAALAHFLVPAALDRLNTRQNEINQDVTARLLTEGTFLHPSRAVTLYTRDIDEDGVLHDVFLSDRRDLDVRVIYTADTAYLVQQAGTTSLIMVDGQAQRLRTSDNRLAVANFKDFSYDISNLMRTQVIRARSASAMTTPEFFVDWDQVGERTGQSKGFIAEEFHSRFAQPAFAAIGALLGFAVLISRGFSRFGAWREILFAFVGLLTLDGIRAMLTDMIRDQAGLWPLAYLPAALGTLLVMVLLNFAARPRRRPKPRRTEVAAP